jgi:cell division transport system permease protein
MALKVDYVAKETAINLRRNLTLTLATIVTIAVTLACVGAALLARQGVNRSNIQFKGNVQFIVFMNPDASAAQIDAVSRALNDNPQVKSNQYLNHDQAFAEFKDIFADQPDLTNNITSADIPTNFKVQLKQADSDLVLSLVSQFEKQPGVKDVRAAAKQVKEQEDAFAKMSAVLIVGAITIGVASLVLIVNSIRIAMFARRREIEVMKLVGATNWFIRVPFMVEGMIQGLVGAFVGIGIVIATRSWVLPTLVDTGGVFAGFRLTSADVQSTAVLLVVGGVLVGIFGSAVAASRFLDV